jgi:hypothetical protein
VFRYTRTIVGLKYQRKELERKGAFKGGSSARGCVAHPATFNHRACHTEILVYMTIMLNERFNQSNPLKS